MPNLVSIDSRVLEFWPPSFPFFIGLAMVTHTNVQALALPCYTVIRTCMSCDVAGIEKEEVSEVYMGNVIQTSLGQNPARQAALFAGLLSHCCRPTSSGMCSKIPVGLTKIMQTGKFANENRALLASRKILYTTKCKHFFTRQPPCLVASRGPCALTFSWLSGAEV